MACSPLTHVINTCLLYKSLCAGAYEVIILKCLLILWRQYNITANLNYRAKQKLEHTNNSYSISFRCLLFIYSYGGF